MNFIIWITVFSFVTVSCSSGSKRPTSESSASGKNFKYNDLMLKDYDEMYRMVQALIQKSRNATVLESGKEEAGGGDEQAAVEELRTAIKLILSRPDSDNMVSKLMPEVRRDLTGLNAFEDTLSSVNAEAMDSLRSDNATVIRQSTSLFILTNTLAEIRPELERNPDLRRIAVQIRDAKLEIPREVNTELKLRSMIEYKSPSEEAKRLLKPIEEKEKKQNKK